MLLLLVKTPNNVSAGISQEHQQGLNELEAVLQISAKDLEKLAIKIPIEKVRAAVKQIYNVDISSTLNKESARDIIQANNKLSLQDTEKFINLLNS
ncbi:MAG: hypothetical protein JNK66_07195 [Chitinophagales bacterium]|nr:hypothetical protein [Chitinophagales bacterium]